MHRTKIPAVLISTHLFLTKTLDVWNNFSSGSQTEPTFGQSIKIHYIFFFLPTQKNYFFTKDYGSDYSRVISLCIYDRTNVGKTVCKLKCAEMQSCVELIRQIPFYFLVLFNINWGKKSKTIKQSHS